MALAKCPDCGSDVSTSALACPKCGRPIASTKKASLRIPTVWGLVIIALATVWIIASLVDGDSDSTGSVSSATGPPPTERQGCEISDFVISNVRTSWNTNGGAVMLTAVVTNSCAESAAPQLKWTAYYGDGSVAFTDEFWPASTGNIAPHQSYHIQDMQLARPHNWIYTLEVVRVNKW